MTPSHRSDHSISRRTFVKNSALTVGAVTILARGTALADVPSGMKEVITKQTYTIETPEATGEGMSVFDTTDPRSHNTQYSLAIEDALKDLATSGHLVANVPVKGNVPIAAIIDHIKTTGGPNGGKPYVLISHLDTIGETPDGAVEVCNVTVKLLEDSTDVTIEYIWK